MNWKLGPTQKDPDEACTTHPQPHNRTFNLHVAYSRTRAWRPDTSVVPYLYLLRIRSVEVDQFTHTPEVI